MKVKDNRQMIPKEVRETLEDERAASWKYLLPAGRRADVLVMASCLNSVPFGLARSFGSVTVSGLGPEEAETLKLWAEENGLNGLKAVGDIGSLQGRRFDVIVNEAGPGEMPGFCEKALKPGGVVVCLGRSRLSKASGLSARRCAGAWKKDGWTVEGVYAFLPSLDEYKLVVPVRPAGVFRSGLEMHNTLTLPSGIKKLGVKLLGSVGLLERLMPGYAVVLTIGGGGERPEGWLRKYLSGKTGQKDFYIVVHNASPGEGAKAILKLTDAAGGPLAYVKIADNRARGEYIENEYRALVNLRALSLKTGEVPKPVAFDLADGHYVMVLEPSDEVFAGNLRTIDGRAIDFLIELFKKTSSIKTIGESGFWKEAAPVFDEFAAGPFGKSYWWLSEMGYGLFARLKGVRLPFGVAHRDFTGWNIKRLHDGRLYVMDWEWSRPDHIPMQDFFHFILLTEWANSGRNVEEILRDAFFSGETRYAGFLRRYAEALDIPVETGYYLLLLYLVEWTVFHIRQIGGVRQWAEQTLDFLNRARGNGEFIPERWLKG
ncbi:MAG: hypothetical protein HY893_02890 [Deltaproteobacteria bacterium]|nr:hypothetical protein [Deltaproteobacteria bacterium]